MSPHLIIRISLPLPGPSTSTLPSQTTAPLISDVSHRAHYPTNCPCHPSSFDSRATTHHRCRGYCPNPSKHRSHYESRLLRCTLGMRSIIPRFVSRLDCSARTVPTFIHLISVSPVIMRIRDPKTTARWSLRARSRRTTRGWRLANTLA